MSYRPIEGCEFAFKCTREWNQLTKTDTDDKRFCFACERTVHLCDASLLLDLHVKASHCVAVPHPTRKTFYVGSPTVEYHATKLVC